jgi:hypothetical protein
MQARIQARRSPAIVLVFVFVLVAAMLLSATAGYLLRPVSTVAGPTRFIVVTTTQASPSQPGCVVVDGHKGC